MSSNKKSKNKKKGTPDPNKGPTPFALYMEERRLQLGPQPRFKTRKQEVNSFLFEWNCLAKTERDKYKTKAEAVSKCPSGLVEPLENKSYGPSEFENDEKKNNEKEARISENAANVEKFLQAFGTNIKKAEIILVHANSYCRIEHIRNPLEYGKNYDYYPAELAFSALTLEHGIIDNYWILIDIGWPFPPAGVGQINKAHELYDLPLPNWKVPQFYDENEPGTYFGRIVMELRSFSEVYQNPWEEDSDPRIVFCLNRDMDKVSGCLDYIYEKAGTSEKLFQIYSYEQLVLSLYELGEKNEIPLDDQLVDSKNHRRLYRFDVYTDPGKLLAEIRGNETSCQLIAPPPLKFEIPFPKTRYVEGVTVDEDQLDYLSHQGVFLSRPQVELFSQFGKYFKQKKELGCLFHQTYDRGFHYCSLHTVNRQAYIILEHLTAAYGINVREGRQRPAEASQEKLHRQFLLAKWFQLGYIGYPFGELKTEVAFVT